LEVQGQWWSILGMQLEMLLALWILGMADGLPVALAAVMGAGRLDGVTFLAPATAGVRPDYIFGSLSLLPYLRTTESFRQPPGIDSAGFLI
jgi:hypothetical protein